MPSDKLQLQTENALAPKMSFKELIAHIAHSDLTEKTQLKLLYKIGDLLVQKVFLMIFDARDKQEIIHMGTTLKHFVVTKAKLARHFNPLQPKTLEFELLPNMELSLFKQRESGYDRLMFDTWDGDFIEKATDMFYLLFKSEHFSLEMYLIAYIKSNMGYKQGYTYYLEGLAEDKQIMNHLKKTNNILYYVIPEMIKIIHKNKHYQKRYRGFEKKVGAMIRILVDKKPKDQYVILESIPKLRKFIDAIKTRSHLPTVYGMYIMAICKAMCYSKKEISKFIQNPEKAPESLKSMMGYYWIQILLPFDETK